MKNFPCHNGEIPAVNPQQTVYKPHQTEMASVVREFVVDREQLARSQTEDLETGNPGDNGDNMPAREDFDED